MKDVKLKDIAKKAGVAQSTVSFVLNGNSRVSDETRQKVLKTIEEMNYSPNRLGRSLKSQTTTIIAFVVSQTNMSPVVFQIFSGVVKQCAALNFHPMWFAIDCENPTTIDSVFSYNPCAVVCVALFKEQVKRLLRRQPNLVIVERPGDLEGIDYVGVDDFKGGYLSAKHLMEHGHRKIAFFTGPHFGALETARAKGWRDALEESGGEAKDEWIVNMPDYSIESGRLAMEKMMELKPSERPTAVMGGSDQSSIGAIQYLREQGVRVPEEISVVGFDDTVSKYCVPPLTTVHQPLEEFGMVAVRILQNKIDGTLASMPQRVTLPPSLVSRATVAESAK